MFTPEQQELVGLLVAFLFIVVLVVHIVILAFSLLWKAVKSINEDHVFAFLALVVVLGVMQGISIMTMLQLLVGLYNIFFLSLFCWLC